MPISDDVAYPANDADLSKTSTAAALEHQAPKRLGRCRLRSEALFGYQIEMHNAKDSLKIVLLIGMHT